MIDTISKNWFPLCHGFVLTTWILVFLGEPGAAQQPNPTEIGDKAFHSANFPWHESKTNTARAVESVNNRAAASINRNQIRKRVTKLNQGQTAQGNGGQPVSNYFSNLSSVGLIILAALLAGLLVWSLLRAAKPLAETTPDHALDERQTRRDRIQELPFELNDGAEIGLEERAQEAADAGDYSKAIMLLFSCVLLSLDQKGLIRLRRGTTNRQYLNEIRQHDNLSTFYQQIMVPFEESFFGGRATNQKVFEQCWRNLAQFRQSLT